METTASPPSVFLSIAAVLALVMANGYFVAAEFALVSARKTRLEESARDGDGKATLALRVIQSLDRYISATQLGITLASLGLGWIGEPQLARLVEGLFQGLPAALAEVATHGVAVAIAFTIITTLHIVLGELVPKSIALLYPESVSRWLALPLIGFAWLMHYPIAMLHNTANAILRLTRIRSAGNHDRLHSAEEIRILVEQSGEGGSLGKQDASMLAGVFEFSEKNAEEVMTPRTDMIALEADLTVEQAADAIAAAGRSRYPVYTESLDEITGVVLAKDVLRAVRHQPGSLIRSIMRQPFFVPGSREVEDVLTDMKRMKTHFAVVLDEYGGTAGLVTMEDLLEEIVGEIYDEHDTEGVLPTITSGDGSLLLDGALTIADFNHRFEVELEDSDYTTLGGYLFGQLGRLPQEGDRVHAAGLDFQIATMAGRRVDKVRVILPS
ncbi:MAG: hemolysin family protein [Gemmatimonadota bacterium]